MRIPLQDLPSTSKLIRAYLNKSTSTKSLYHHYFDSNGWEDQIKEKSKNYTMRKELAAELKKQLSILPLSENQQKNLERLSSDNTFTICTGHQLNLFTGPIYFFYKILQVIKQSEELKKQFPEYHFVPIFWMASEDHDFEEINHCYLQEKRVEWNSHQTGAVGRFTLEGVQKPVMELQQFLQHYPYFDEVNKWVTSSYLESENLAQATQSLVQQIFGEKGLLIIDGDSKNLKNLFKEKIAEELFQQTIYNSSKESLKLLESQKFKIQVNPREINLFYLQEHSRNRIVEEGEIFKIVDTDVQFSKEEMAQELENHPERFSPNAIFRPVYQEFLLPNIAYIGGNAEIAYWLELQNCFAAFGLTFPILIPRNAFLLVQQRQLQKWKNMGLTENDMLLSIADLEKKLVEKYSLLDLNLEEKHQQIEEIYSELIAKSKQTDKSLENLLQAEKTKQLKSFQKMEKRLFKAEKRIYSDKIESLKRQYEQFYPNGVLQERRVNGLDFYSQWGENLFTKIWDSIDCNQACMNIISIDGD